MNTIEQNNLELICSFSSFEDTGTLLLVNKQLSEIIPTLTSLWCQYLNEEALLFKPISLDQINNEYSAWYGLVQICEMNLDYSLWKWFMKKKFFYCKNCHEKLKVKKNGVLQAKSSPSYYGNRTTCSFHPGPYHFGISFVYIF